MIGVVAKLAIQEGKIDEAIDLIKELMVSVAEEESQHHRYNGTIPGQGGSGASFLHAPVQGLL